MFSLATYILQKSSIYINDMTDNLYVEMNSFIIEWYTNPPCCRPNNLYILLIAHSKAVLFVIQLDMDCVRILLILSIKKNLMFFILH